MNPTYTSSSELHLQLAFFICNRFMKLWNRFDFILPCAPTNQRTISTREPQSLFIFNKSEKWKMNSYIHSIEFETTWYSSQAQQNYYKDFKISKENANDCEGVLWIEYLYWEWDSNPLREMVIHLKKCFLLNRFLHLFLSHAICLAGTESILVFIEIGDFFVAIKMDKKRYARSCFVWWSCLPVFLVWFSSTRLVKPSGKNLLYI